MDLPTTDIIEPFFLVQVTYPASEVKVLCLRQQLVELPYPKQSAWWCEGMEISPYSVCFALCVVGKNHLSSFAQTYQGIDKMSHLSLFIALNLTCVT